MTDGHGDDSFRYQGKIRMNFSSNIPQGISHHRLMSHLCHCSAIIGSYPEPEPRSLERRLACLNSVHPENVIATAGATEAIYLLAHLFSSSRSAVLAPSFREYQDACRIFCHHVSFLTSLADITKCNARVVWLCNPNNPDGRVFHHDELLATASRFPASTFIIDQAYAPYSVKQVLSAGDAISAGNIVILASLTKTFMVPGLRIGYAIGPADIINDLRRLRMPWSVNAPAIEAAGYLLSHSDEYAVDSIALHREACRIGESLSSLGIDVSPTDCNFLLCCLPDRKASRLKEWLIHTYGILIRDASNFEGLSPRHFRIAAQSPSENNLLINAVKEWMSLS